MNKPQPKQELIIKPLPGNCVYITMHTNDAWNWVQKEGREYGTILNFSHTRAAMLYLYDGYNKNEVIEYLLSYNN